MLELLTDNLKKTLSKMLLNPCTCTDSETVGRYRTKLKQIECEIDELQETNNQMKIPIAKIENLCNSQICVFILFFRYALVS